METISREEGNEMIQKYPHLLRPIRIGDTLLKNRIIAAPTGMMDLTPDGRLTPYNVSYYELKAKGGAAVVTIGESITDSRTGESHNRQIHLDDPNSMPGLAHTVRAIQRWGALANIELSHGGKYGGLTSIAGEETADRTAYGPSDDVSPIGERIYEMSIAMIDGIVVAYRKAAALCKKSGFDMVMIHAAHGWLFNQFLSPLENKRTDIYGGSLENRARFLIRVLDAVREEVGPKFPIELRLNGDDFLEGAMTREDYLELAKMVEGKVDLINVSAGSHEAENLFVRTHPSMFLEHGCNVYLAEGIKKVVSIPVACVGGITTAELAEEIIASGKADIVELGRALLADPYFPKKVQEGKGEDITPCLRCFNCFESIVNTTVVACAVNPIIGNELDAQYFSPTDQRKKKVLVVGGGPGGMEAAITAAQNGHQVILCEKSEGLGGTLKFAAFVPFKEDLHRFARVLERRVYQEKIEVRLNVEVDRDYVLTERPDVLIISVGATPIIPSIPGATLPKVMTAAEAEKQLSHLGDKITIIGGGLVGCETGIHLGMRGKEVTIIEMRDSLAPEANQFHKMALNMELKKYINQMTSTRVQEITTKGVCCETSEGDEVLIEADHIILAVGVRSNDFLQQEYHDLSPEVYVIGDSLRPGQVMQAMQQGYYVSRGL